jgi:hypothetical protein
MNRSFLLANNIFRESIQHIAAGGTELHLILYQPESYVFVFTIPRSKRMPGQKVV